MILVIEKRIPNNLSFEPYHVYQDEMQGVWKCIHVATGTVAVADEDEELVRASCQSLNNDFLLPS